MNIWTITSSSGIVNMNMNDIKIGTDVEKNNNDLWIGDERYDAKTLDLPSTINNITVQISQKNFRNEIIKKATLTLERKNLVNGGKKSKKTTKKISTRPSPSYPASDCPVGSVRKGNDGKMYRSTLIANGVRRWVAVAKK